MEAKPRSLRRHHKDRMKAKARKLWPEQPRAFYRADYLAGCSCCLCTWWKHHERPREKRADVPDRDSYEYPVWDIHGWGPE